MKLNAEEQAMLGGELGEPRRWAIEHMQRVGRFFDAPDLVEVTLAHIMADTESLGEAGVRFLEQLARHPEPERRVRIPMITDPRGIDFCHYKRLKQTDAMAALDDNGDGKLKGKELQHLALWHDRNQNGESEAGEVRSLADHGIVELDCSFTTSDSHLPHNPQGVKYRDGHTRPSCDVILRRHNTQAK